MKNYFAIMNVGNDSLVGIVGGSTDKELNLAISYALRDELQEEDMKIPELHISQFKAGRKSFFLVNNWEGDVIGDFSIEPTWIHGEQ